MSYILEALKKSEQERQLGAVPRPELALPAQRHPLRSGWPWLLAVVLLLNAGILVWLMLRPAQLPWLAQDGTGVTAADPPAGVPAAAADAPAAAAATGTGREPQTLAASGTATADTQTAARVPPAAPLPPAPAQPEPVSRPPPVRGSVQWMSLPETAVSEPAPPDATGVPYWEELSQSERSGLTRPRLDVHVYAEVPTQRFVLIDLRRYREGERLAGGGRLETITPEGVIIAAGGIRYRIGRP